MDFTHSPLYGFWGYLLMGELAAVSALSWLAIAMVIRRLRYPEAPEKGDVPLSSERVEDSDLYKALLEKLQGLENEKSQWEKAAEAPSVSEVSQLKETISFLENKLLSYEIVQEEISTLGILKAENEKLKVELSTLKNATLVSGPVEEAIEKRFTEFTETKPAETAPSEGMPNEIKSLLTDIEKLSQK